jgi:hypothetical protein
MIPLAIRLRERGFTIIIGTGKKYHRFFAAEIPGIECICLPGFRPGYSSYLPQYLILLAQIPLLVWHSIAENFRLKKIIKKRKIDIVISDNRFGLRSSNIRSVYVTHQIRIPFPEYFRFLEPAGIWLHRQVIRKFSLCIIPDLPGDLNLSGKLSHDVRLPGNTIYTGILSRFTCTEDDKAGPAVDPGGTVVMLSGPEPQRSILEKKLLQLFTDNITKTIFLAGRPDCDDQESDDKRPGYFSHLQGSIMKKILAGSGRIITRPGYTSIMELVSLGKSAILIPTPGQTEQEYLAGLLRDRGWFACLPQKCVGELLPPVPAYSFPADEIIRQSSILLETALDRILEDKK